MHNVIHRFPTVHWNDVNDGMMNNFTLNAHKVCSRILCWVPSMPSVNFDAYIFVVSINVSLPVYSSAMSSVFSGPVMSLRDSSNSQQRTPCSIWREWCSFKPDWITEMQTTVLAKRFNCTVSKTSAYFYTFVVEIPLKGNRRGRSSLSPNHKCCHLLNHACWQ